MRTRAVIGIVLPVVLAAAGCRGLAQNRTQVFDVCESGQGYIQGCATWSITGQEGDVAWADGGTAKLRIEHFDDAWVRMNRTSITGSRSGRKADYTGRGFGNGVYGGQVREYGGGASRQGVWKATARGTAATQPVTQTFDHCEWGEGDLTRYCGTLFVTGLQGRVDWGERVVSNLTISRFDDRVVFWRPVPRGPYQGVRISYTGSRDGTGYAGEWSSVVNGARVSGSWKATPSAKTVPQISAASQQGMTQAEQAVLWWIFQSMIGGGESGELRGGRARSSDNYEDEDTGKDREQFEENQYYLQRREYEEQREQEDRER